MLSVWKLTSTMSWGGLVGSVGLLGTAARLGRLPEYEISPWRMSELAARDGTFAAQLPPDGDAIRWPVGTGGS